MIEMMTKRLSGILNRYKLPIALQVSINKTVRVGICMKTVSKDLLVFEENKEYYR